MQKRSFKKKSPKDTSNAFIKKFSSYLFIYFGQVVELLFQGKLRIDVLIIKISLLANLCGIYFGPN